MMKFKIGTIFTIIGVILVIILSISSAILQISGISGSIKLFIIVLLIAIILTLFLIFNSSERKNLLLAIISGKRSADDYNIDLRQNFNEDIFYSIEKAKNEITFLGGISSVKSSII